MWVELHPQRSWNRRDRAQVAFLPVTAQPDRIRNFITAALLNFEKVHGHCWREGMPCRVPLVIVVNEAVEPILKLGTGVVRVTTVLHMELVDEAFCWWGDTFPYSKWDHALMHHVLRKSFNPGHPVSVPVYLVGKTACRPSQRENIEISDLH